MVRSRLMSTAGGERTDDAVPGGLDFVGTHTAHVLVVGLEAGRA